MNVLPTRWIGWLLLLPALCACGRETTLLYVPRADVSTFAASASHGVVHVTWQTTLELGIQRFLVLGSPSGTVSLTPVGPGEVSATGDESGARYDLTDPVARPGAAWHYELHLAADGSDKPLAVWDGTIAEARTVSPLGAIAPVTGGDVVAWAATPVPQCWIGAGPRVQSWTNSPPADRVRLSLRFDGLYRVAASELAAAMGVSTTQITTAIAQTNLCLTCQGASVSWCSDGSGTNLYFYGLAPTTHDAPENVYWVSLEAGAAMSANTQSPASPGVTNRDFAATIFVQGTNYFFRVTRTAMVGPSLPDTTYTAFNAGASSSQQQPLWAAATGSWSGTVTLRLLSGCEAGTDHHQIDVSVGGTALGSTIWDGEQEITNSFAFSSSSLAAGNLATLLLQNNGTAYFYPVNNAPNNSRVFWESYAFTYPRLYQATNGFLRCTGGTGDTVCVTGFATNDLQALDITAPSQPILLSGAVVSRTSTNSSATWQIAFPAGGTDCVYAVFSRSAGTQQPAIRGVLDVNWADPANAADEVILIPPEGWCPGFRQAVQPLADFRNAQGLKTSIVDVESIYNAYSGGLVDTAAIRAFVATGYGSWSTHPLTYLLLAGSGAMDYKHLVLSVNSYAAALIPTIQESQRYPGVANFDGYILGCDQALGDVTGDAAPEVIVGRIPTTKTQDVTTVVQKTIALEGALAWKGRVALGADWDNTGNLSYPFQEETDLLVPSLTTSSVARTIIKLYPSTDPDPGNLVPNRVYTLFPALTTGCGLFHFFGHTSEPQLGGGSGPLLNSTDIVSSNWKKAPIAFIMGCRVNRWQSMSSTAVIGPSGFLASGTGFAAVIAPTGFFLAEDGANVATTFYATAAREGSVRLGDLFRRTLQQTASSMTVASLQSLSLLGDPALVYRHDVTGLSTPVSWLMSYGLTNANADATNRAADGWAVWQDYQAGLSPDTKTLRITGVQARTNSPGRLTVSFTSASNATYRILQGDSLLATGSWPAVSWAQTNGAGWLPADSLIPAAAPITAVDAPLPAAATQGFFRVQLVP